VPEKRRCCPHRIGDHGVAEVVAAHRDDHAAPDVEGHEQRLVVVVRLDRHLVARLELGLGASRLLARLHGAVAVDEVIDRGFERELADRLEALRPGAEAERAGRLLEVRPPHEPDLGIEGRSHLQVLGAHAVAIRRPLEAPLVALVVASEAVGVGAGVVGASRDVLVEGKRGIYPVGLVVAGGAPRRRSGG
jgi:hypothetical protein